MLVLGVLLVLLTVAVAVAIATKANQSVKQFADSDHEIFLGSE